MREQNNYSLSIDGVELEFQDNRLSKDLSQKEMLFTITQKN
jgi:hypothetical protein